MLGVTRESMDVAIARTDERKCKLIRRCGCFLSCSDYY